MSVKKIYISGRISGLPIGEVIAKFKEAEQKIRHFGFEPVNPFDNGLPLEAEWADQMGRDIAMLLRADSIYMLPDWRESRGATIEYLIARQMHMKVFLAETFPAAENEQSHEKEA